MEPKYYQSRLPRIAGTDYYEILGKARAIYRDLDTQTGRRNTFVRSAYFDKQKIFLETYWNHFGDKHLGQRKQRIPYYAATIDLLKNTTVEPVTYLRGKDKYYRFSGITKDNYEFIVQIKENKKGEKYHMSSFPPGHQK